MLLCLRVVQPQERLAVFRRGQFCRIAGPGFTMVLVPFERCTKIDLSRYVPEWSKLNDLARYRAIERLVDEGKIPNPWRIHVEG